MVWEANEVQQLRLSLHFFEESLVLVKYGPDQQDRECYPVALSDVAQALAGAALSGKSKEQAETLIATTSAEQAALGKLLANWNSLIERRLKSGGPLFDK